MHNISLNLIPSQTPNIHKLYRRLYHIFYIIVEAEWSEDDIFEKCKNSKMAIN